MGEEAAFLSAIRQTPADDTARLVYADWLDERGDADSKSRAEFIRLEIQMAATPEQSLNRVRWLTKLQKLAAALDSRWLAIISHPKLEACRVSFRFRCPKQWDKLTPTEDDKVRLCASCKQHVHYCETLDEARGHAAQGHCVAVSLALVRRCDDLYPPRAVMTGGLSRLTSQVIEDFSVAGRPDPPSEIALPVPPLRREWVPEPDAEHARPRQRKRRRKGRTPNRNIQRQNWEEE